VKVGILTSGGDAPGLNAVLRSVVRKGERVYGDTFVGFLDGYKGMLDREFVGLDVERCRGFLPKGGTALGTSRLSPYQVDNGAQRERAEFDRLGLDALIVVGGEGSLSVARKLHEDVSMPIVGVPKTIDNDLYGTDVTFGFHTAVQIATEAIDRLHTTAESHDRVMVVELMGRHAGWIATYAGIAGGASEILIPEDPFDIEEVCERLRRRHERGRLASIVVVAEGALPKEGTMDMPSTEQDGYGHIRLGGISNIIGAEIEKRTGFDTRVTILGHVQRGGTPTAYDRVLATRYGLAAIDAVHAGAFNHMVALHGGEIQHIPLTEATSQLKTVDKDLFGGVAGIFFGS